MSFTLDTIEKYVSNIRFGENGEKIKTKFPLKLSIKNIDNFSVKRNLFEHKLSKIAPEPKRTNLTDIFSKKDNFVYVDALKYFSKYEKRHYKVISKNKDFIEIKSYGRGDKIRQKLPRNICINEFFSKFFGVWLGDRGGGYGVIGLGLQDSIVLNHFREFLKTIFIDKQITLEIIYHSLYAQKHQNPQ